MNVYPLSLRIFRGWAPPHLHQALAIGLGILLELAGSPSQFPVEPQMALWKPVGKIIFVPTARTEPASAPPVALRSGQPSQNTG